MFAQKLIAKSLVAVAMIGGAVGVAQAQQQNNEINQIKTALKINASQESIWNSFVTTYSQSFKPSRNPTAAEFNAMKTPQRIEFLKNLRAEEGAFLNKRYDASVNLYSKLDDSQKKAFDDMTAQPVQQAAPAKAANSHKGKK